MVHMHHNGQAPVEQRIYKKKNNSTFLHVRIDTLLKEIVCFFLFFVLNNADVLKTRI